MKPNNLLVTLVVTLISIFFWACYGVDRLHKLFKPKTKR